MPQEFAPWPSFASRRYPVLTAFIIIECLSMIASSSCETMTNAFFYVHFSYFTYVQMVCG